MKKVFLIPALAFVLFAVGCGGSSNQTEATTTETEVADEHHHGEISEVQLDNGEKWVANPETTEGINNMLASVSNAASNESPDYVKLKENLEKEFMVILEKCTMTGESHDQLHNYLLPLKAKYDQLEASSTAHDLEELTHYLTTYSSYFK